MLRNVANSIHRTCRASAFSRNSPLAALQQAANFGTAEKKGSIISAWEKSCYHEMDYTISEDASVYEAVEKFSGYDIGALVTTDAEGKMTGVISERDYIKKVALLGKISKDTRVS